MGASGYISQNLLFSIIFYVHPDPLGCMIQLDEDIFEIGFLQQPTTMLIHPCKTLKPKKHRDAFAISPPRGGSGSLDFVFWFWNFFPDPR